MKTNSYLWSMLAAATFTLAGCGSEENGITEPMPQGKTAQLELRLTRSEHQGNRKRIAYTKRREYGEAFHRRHLQQRRIGECHTDRNQ